MAESSGLSKILEEHDKGRLGRMNSSRSLRLFGQTFSLLRNTLLNLKAFILFGVAQWFDFCCCLTVSSSGTYYFPFAVYSSRNLDFWQFSFLNLSTLGAQPTFSSLFNGKTRKSQRNFGQSVRRIVFVFTSFGGRLNLVQQELQHQYRPKLPLKTFLPD